MEGRRRVTLYDQMTAGNSSSRDSLASLMLDDVVFKKTEAEGSRRLSRSGSRTLQDIIYEDEPNNNNNVKDHRKPWQALKDKLRFKHTNVNDNVNTTTLPSSQARLDSAASTQHNSAAQQQNDVIEEDVNDSDPTTQLESPVDNPVAGSDSSDEGNNHAPAGMSLMDLLEETEQEMDLYRMSDDDDVEEYGKEEEGGGAEEKGGVVEYNCCVCMVRHKGAAFIPCGHTFCRMCSREIWVNRGNCPLCNNLILEILDIF
ncbi:E3 ubiquitin-protein ligase complex SLX5-SLX8 subunit SLX8-like [Abrus precatorius]|uniref:E3 ubiquitin-protein ligase complex SLX5-SLX8 subunit SLX8-like n=1 Tax=Abrus precatorius TaxID=3816 RepID=A0A8B8K2G2_ABRPR|nr:E3 ubiquitin-protein ligase complex SLX5-SLX8 subunit SLX8-like [Abrus precatorius]